MTLTTRHFHPSADTTEPRKYVTRYEDGELFVVTAEQVARSLAHAEYTGDTEPITVWTFLDGQPVPVEVRSSGGAFDEDDYADVRVELVAPDGAVLDVTGYRLDGRV
jgi:hypothetical protein